MLLWIAKRKRFVILIFKTDLVNWSNSYDRSSIYFRQQSLCKTLSGNDCPVLTITNLENLNENQPIPTSNLFNRNVWYQLNHYLPRRTNLCCSNSTSSSRWIECIMGYEGYYWLFIKWWNLPKTSTWKIYFQSMIFS